jgi:beta-galactosidase
VRLLGLLLLLATPLAAQRQRQSLDLGWRFHLGDAPGAEAPRFDDRAWRAVDVPHDWSIEGVPVQDAPVGGRGGFFPTGIGWYRRTFTAPGGGRVVWIEFDGVYMNADVWVNGKHLGKRPYGYISFAYDITPHVVQGSNVIAVRVDNSRQPGSRWYTGSGIYRHVWLTTVDRLHIGHWGVTVTTPRVDSIAEVVVHTRLENEAGGRSGTLRAIVLDSDGREIGRADAQFSFAPGHRDEIELRIRIATPRLWSVEQPYLYTLRAEVASNRRVVDRTDTPFGIRSIAYDKDQGFLLNGRPVKMKGVNLHHDAGALGAAVPENVWEQRLRLLKAMGANAIRTSHNPPAPEFLDLCDRLGILVMAEAFDEWTFGKVPEGYHQYFDEWSGRDVTDFVRRDRNHPSIVLWSAGNEIGEQGAPNGAAVLRRLMDIFHREDSTRPVTTGNDNIAAEGHPATAAFLNALDVVGYNYVDRWRERREIMAEPDRQAHPEWKMIGTESGSMFASTADPYSLSEVLQAQRVWKWVATHDYFAGNFIWTGIDYLGESFWPFKGFQSGMLDITGYPKDAYYLYQSLWAETPVLHLLPHWNWSGREGQVIPVIAYTNCNVVELFLNGRSLGEKRLEFPAQGTSGGWNTYALPRVSATTNDLHLAWDVPYEPGVVSARGKKRDGSPCGAAEIRTAGVPAAIRLSADQETVRLATRDLAYVRFAIVDSSGTVIPTATNDVRFSTTGGGTIVALDNADLQSHDSYKSDHRRAYNGRGVAILRPGKPGTLTLTAAADGLRAATVTIRVQ